MTQRLAPHGTRAAGKRHYNHGEPLCEPCWLALSPDARSLELVSCACGCPRYVHANGTDGACDECSCEGFEVIF